MTEIKTIVLETLIGKPEDEVQTFEKCLRLVGSNRTRKDQEIGFCLLAKLVIKCSSQTLRVVQSRLANRFAQISDHYQLCGSLFVRELLIRNPQAGDLHSPIVFKIILNCMDAAAQTSDVTIRGLAAELFALRIDNQNLTILLNTLEVLLSANKIKNVTSDLLQLNTLGVSSHQNSLISLLFEVLALSLGYASKPGISIERKSVIQVIELGIHNPQSRSVAFACLRSLCLNTKHSLIPMIGRVVSTLIVELETPDADLMKTLAFISKTFGAVTSTLYKHFYVIFTALKQPLHEQCYGEHAGNLLASIIESSAGFIKPEVFITVQKAVCESAIMYPDVTIYLQMLSAFLALNNEFVPSPLQVARSVSFRTRNTTEYARRLKAICDVASRPRTTDMANVKVKKTLILKESHSIEAPVHTTSPTPEFREEEDIKVLEEILVDEPEEFFEKVDHAGASKASEKNPEETKQTPRKKKNSESIPAVVKKKKAIAHEMKTDLLEGEASVDEILNFFDMS